MTSNKGMVEDKTRYILLELAHHLPYSIFGVVSAMILMGVLTFIVTIAQAESLMPAASAELFHLFHPTHVLFSAIATTAMFWKHDEHNIFKAALVGMIGSVAVCGVSDVFIPFVGGKILGQEMHLHICLLTEPMLVYPFAAIGVMAGFMVTKTFEKSTQLSHSMHVFLSSTASLLYLISFGLTHWVEVVAGVFLVTVVAVMFPCCLSDIVFPIMCSHRYCRHDGPAPEKE